MKHIAEIALAFCVALVGLCLVSAFVGGVLALAYRAFMVTWNVVV